VKSINPCQSVIKTFYDIVKVHGGEVNVETEIENATTIPVIQHC